MARPSFDSVWSDPPYQQFSLCQGYCTDCPAAAVCGERRAASACDHPASYARNSLHPATDLIAAQDFELPTTARIWGLPFRPPQALVVASHQDAPFPVYGTDLRTTLENQPRQPGTRRIALLFGSDSTLDRLWRRRAHYLRRIEAKGYVAIVGPAFSNWDTCTPYHGLAYTSASAAIADLAARHLATVPALMWRTHRDIDRQVDWLARGRLEALALDLGTGDWPRWLTGITYLVRRLERECGYVPRLVAHGVSSYSKIGQLSTHWPGTVTVASQVPWQLAGSKIRLTEELARVKIPWADPRELLIENVQNFRSAVDALLGERGEEEGPEAVADAEPA